MSDKPKVSTIIPAFNEEGGIGPVIKGLQAVLEPNTAEYEIIVIDDGSSDKTAQEAQEAGAKVIRHPANRGYGRALLSGIDEARHEWILMTDGDGSYPPEEATKMLAGIPRFDMVIGTRQGRLFWGSPMKAFLRWMYLTMAGIVVGESIPDANSGMRIFRLSSFKESMPFFCLGYSFSTTMTLSFINAGAFVLHQPINFVARTGSSKVRFIRDILRTLQIMAQVILYFNPLKLTVLMAIAELVLGLAIGWMLCSKSQHSLSAAVTIAATVTAIGTFLVGLLLEMIRLNIQPSGSLGRKPTT